MYLLDTNVLRSAGFDGVRLAERIRQTPRTELFISIVTVAEVLHGWLTEINRHQGRANNDICGAYDRLATAYNDLRSFTFVRYSTQADAVYRSFPSAVKRVGTNDCRIAATAIAHGMIVVTCNTRDFAKIPDVRFEDWTAP